MRQVRDETYFTYLLDTYQKLVYSICFRAVGNQFDAEDLTQETYLSIYKNLSGFDRRYEKAWVCRIASNKCLDFLKSKSRSMAPTEDAYFHAIEDTGATPEESYLEKESKEYVRKVCQSLKEPYREVAILHFYEERSVREVAEYKGKSIKTVQTQVYRAKAMIKKVMEARLPPPDVERRVEP